MTQLMAMGLSLAVEVPVVLLVVWAWGGISDTRPAVTVGLVATAATLVSHPLAWTACAALTATWSFGVSVFWVEVAVILFEGGLYGRALKLGLGRGIALSAVANGISFGVGLWITG